MDETVASDDSRSEVREGRVSGDRIQRLVDDLASELGLPVSVDDEKFRLQFYSPQQGKLDRVRIESILVRDSPEEAKDWVRAHKVEDARGPTWIPAAEELGLLSRVCTPLHHQDSLLGYLWIIDADMLLDEHGVEQVRRTAAAIAPLLYRRRFFERLDRQAERDALIDLIDARVELRQRGIAAFTAAGCADVTAARILVIRILSPSGGSAAGDESAVELGLEIALERHRGLFPADQFWFFRRGTEGVVLLMRSTAEQAEQRGGACERLHAAVRHTLAGSAVTIGVGRSVSSLAAVVTSYLDARDAAEISSRDPSPPAVLNARWLGAQRALLTFPQAVLRQLADDALGPLQAHPESELLLTTLEAFLLHGGAIPAVADELALHRSSVYGRLRRIATILDADLGDGEVRLALHHALVALRLAGDGQTRHM